MFRTIVVGFEGGDAARQGLATGLRLAADQHATLYVLHVLDGMPAAWSSYVDAQFRPDRIEVLLQGLRVAGQRVLDEAMALAAKQGQVVKPLLIEARGRTVAEVILAQLRELEADAVVLGTHGREGISRLVMGSAAEDVLRHADVPVLLVRAPRADAGRARTLHNPSEERARTGAGKTAAEAVTTG